LIKIPLFVWFSFSGFVTSFVPRTLLFCCHVFYSLARKKTKWQNTQVAVPPYLFRVSGARLFYKSMPSLGLPHSPLLFSFPLPRPSPTLLGVTRAQPTRGPDAGCPPPFSPPFMFNFSKFSLWLLIYHPSNALKLEVFCFLPLPTIFLRFPPPHFLLILPNPGLNKNRGVPFCWRLLPHSTFFSCFLFSIFYYPNGSNSEESCRGWQHYSYVHP